VESTNWVSDTLSLELHEDHEKYLVQYRSDSVADMVQHSPFTEFIIRFLFYREI